MDQNKKDSSVSSSIVLLLVIINVFIAKHAFIINDGNYWGLSISLPFLLAALYTNRKRKHPIAD